MAMNDASQWAEVLELPASLAPAGGEAWYFPGALNHGQADIVARVRRRDGSSWTACLGRAPSLGTDADDIFVLPCGQRLFIAGGVVDRDDPTSWRALGGPGLVSVNRGPDQAAVVVNDHTTLHVFGASGPQWTATIGSDIAVTLVTAHEVVCDVYDEATGRTVSRRFAVVTGQPLDPA